MRIPLHPIRQTLQSFIWNFSSEYISHEFSLRASAYFFINAKEKRKKEVKSRRFLDRPRKEIRRRCFKVTARNPSESECNHRQRPRVINIERSRKSGRVVHVHVEDSHQPTIWETSKKTGILEEPQEVPLSQEFHFSLFRGGGYKESNNSWKDRLESRAGKHGDGTRLTYLARGINSDRLAGAASTLRRGAASREW